MTATGTATFNTKDVLTANLVTANTNVLANGTNGGLASNYSLATGQTVAANITPAALTASITAPNKVYNGNTTAAPTFTITGGEVGTETVTATGTATFNTKDVLTANLVTAKHQRAGQWHQWRPGEQLQSGHGPDGGGEHHAGERDDRRDDGEQQGI